MMICCVVNSVYRYTSFRNLLQSYDPGPVKIYPGKCVSKGRLFTKVLSSSSFKIFSLSFTTCDTLTTPHLSTIFGCSRSNIFSFCYAWTINTINFNMGRKYKILNIKMEIKYLAWNENLSKRCIHPLLHQGMRGLIIFMYGCDNHITNKPFTMCRLDWL